ncbi:MAG TPA: GIY-YIG nuclease family protein [Ktedonobacteraceae bacterium]|nr:GIY-YIG nuclease family protein [Ktedonobacteraceae bacterium]
MKQPGIYAIVNKVNGHMYVGSTRDLRGRWWTHRHNLRKGVRENPVLLNAWAKYGEEAFEFVEIELFELLEDVQALKKALEEREQYYIDTLKPVYNVRPIAQNNTGYHPRPESVEKMKTRVTGLKRTPATKELLRQARLGMTFSEEWRENIRIAKSNPSDATRAKMSAAKKGCEPTKATAASVLVTRGKERPQWVKDKISETKRRKFEQGLYKNYNQRPHDEQGRFKKSS